MGAVGTAIFSDDVACDVRDEFLDLLRKGASGADAAKSLIESWGKAVEDYDDGPVFWLALAATAWKYGSLTEMVQQQAITVIDQGLDLRKWSGRSLAKRRSVLEALKQQLLSPQPKARRPRRLKPVLVLSKSLLSPDERALAQAFELPGPTLSDGPRMQVIVGTVTDGRETSGSGVFVAACNYTDVHLRWIDADTLEISYPSTARVAKKILSFRIDWRIFTIRYQLLSGERESVADASEGPRAAETRMFEADT